MPEMILGNSYEDIVEDYADLITRICILNLRNVDDTKDCFQNVLMKLFLKKDDFQDQQHLKRWIIRVSINECHNYQRLFYKPQINIDDVIIAGHQEQLTLLSEVLKLPKKKRNVMYLYYYEGYKCAEIASIMKMKENTVKSHLKRGREELRKKVGEFYE